MRDILVLIGPYCVRNVEQDFMTPRGRDLASAPAYGARVGRNQACEHLEQRGLAGAVRSDQAHDLACRDCEFDIGQYGLIDVRLAQARNVNQLARSSMWRWSVFARRQVPGREGSSVHAQSPRRWPSIAQGLDGEPSEGEPAWPREASYYRSGDASRRARSTGCDGGCWSKRCRNFQTS